MIAHASAGDAARSFVVAISDAILYPLIVLMMAVAVVIFLYGGLEYVLGANNDGAREKGQKHLLWGIVGLVVMVSAYGILSLASSFFGVDVPAPVDTGEGVHYLDNNFFSPQ
tara:strand:+ start:573 stop:908 length:336 start_codon:yes stop_codon:yes gene_type:complete